MPGSLTAGVIVSHLTAIERLDLPGPMFVREKFNVRLVTQRKEKVNVQNGAKFEGSICW